MKIRRDESRSERFLLPVHHALAAQQRRLRINVEQANQILASLQEKSNPFDCQGVLVTNIANHDFRQSVGRYGRVSNNITNLKRNLRAALHVGGEPLLSVDLRCAQPALLARLMMQRGRSRTDGIGRDEEKQQEEQTTTSSSIYVAQNATGFLGYRELTETGELYERLVVELKKRGEAMSREQVKKKFLCDVLAKKRPGGFDYPSTLEDVFRELFLSVYHFVREFNADCHANLIRELQRQESSFVIETVAADLTTRDPGMFIIPLHDAIFTTADGIPAVKQAFERAFEATGFRMAVKVA